MSKRPSRHTGHSDLDEFKKSLGPHATSYSDAQLQQLRREMHAMAELSLNIYLGGKQSGKGIDSHRSGVRLKGERSKNELPLG